MSVFDVTCYFVWERNETEEAFTTCENALIKEIWGLSPAGDIKFHRHKTSQGKEMMYAEVVGMDIPCYRLNSIADNISKRFGFRYVNPSSESEDERKRYYIFESTFV